MLSITNLTLLLQGRDVVLRLVTAILAASSCHAQFPTQETISEMPFGFWYILQDDIIGRQIQNLIMNY